MSQNSRVCIIQVEEPTCENDLWPDALEPEEGILRMLVSAKAVYRWRSLERYCILVPVVALMTIADHRKICYEVIGGATSWATVVNVYLGINKSAAEFLTSFGSWVNDIRS